MEMSTDAAMQKFLAIKDKARALIQMDTSGKLNELAVKNRSKIDMSEDGPSGKIMTESYQPTHQQTTYQQPMCQQPQPSFPVSNSKLPMEIINSFKTNHIDTSPLGLSTQASVLDRIDFNTQGGLFPEAKVANQVPIMEQVPQKQVVTEQMSVGANVDYSMIKMIVDECMRKYTSALKKTILTESKNTQENGTLKAMKIGDKFTFVTDNGDLYEAKLTFIKNISKKAEK